MKLENDEILFDKTVLSYQLLRSIIYNKNKSLLNYTNLIVNTLKEDYNITSEIEKFIINKDDIDFANELIKEFKSNTNNIYELEFDKKYLISTNTYYLLEEKQTSSISLTEEEKQQKWTYDCGMGLWKFFELSNIDAYFFETYIGHYSLCEKYIEKRYKMSRYYKLSETLECNINKFNSKMQDIVNNPDYNLELYRTKKRIYYERLLEGQKLLESINKNKVTKQLRSEFNSKINKYLKEIGDLSKILKLYNFSKPKNYKTELNEKLKYNYCKTILMNAFEIEVKNDSNNKYVYYNFSKWDNLIEKYNLEQ
jgi:hypothetical protein